jgi:hypothetical protein
MPPDDPLYPIPPHAVIEPSAYSNARAFAALKADGSITAWSNPNYGGTGAPSGSGYSLHDLYHPTP